MDLRYLYKLASLLDSQGKYVESDVVYDSMIKIAAPDGRGKTQGRRAPRDNRNFRLSPQQVQQRMNPNTPGLVPVQSAPPVAPQVAANPAAASRLTPQQLLRNFRSSNLNIKAIEEYLTRNNYPKDEFIKYYNETLGDGKYQYDIKRFNETGFGGPNLPRKVEKFNPRTTAAGMNQRFYNQILKEFGDDFGRLDQFLDTTAYKSQFIAQYDAQFGAGAYKNKVLTAVPTKSRPGNQSSSGQGTKPSGNAGTGGATPNQGASSANNAGPGARPGTGGSASAGGSSPNTSRTTSTPGSSASPGSTRPPSQNQLNNDLRKRIWQNRKLNPRLYDLLELEYSAGRFNPGTGDLTESAVETLSRAYERGGPTVVQQGGKAGRGGAAAAKASQFATKAANNPSTAKIVSALAKVSTTVSALKPLLKILPFLGFAASIPEMMNLVNKINQKGWESIWNDPYDRAKAIGVLANTVSAAVSLAPGPLTPVALALSAIGIGSDLGADVARDAGDAAEGGEFKLFGKTLKQKSQQRKQQEAFEAGYNAKELDPQVVSALENSKSLLSSGKKIIDIINDQSMLAKYPWLNNNADPKNAQFRKNIVLLSKSLRAQQSPAQVLSPGVNNQPGQSVYNNAQQSAQPEQLQQLRNHNDLLYKAYVDTVQSTNITLENLKNYRQQIITKINNLAPRYPNINAQQAITALDNRIRKYSEQANPA